MNTRFTAVLSEDRVRWIGAAPPGVAGGGEVVADVVVWSEGAPLPGAGWDGKDLVALLDRIADAGTFDDIEDPTAWQRSMREGRE